MGRIVVWLSLFGLVFAGADTEHGDVATDRDGGGHGHHGEKHPEHNALHHHEHNAVQHPEYHAKHNEVDHSEHQVGHKELLKAEHRGGGAVGNAVQKLEKQFMFLLRHVTGLIDPAVSSVRSACELSSLQTRSYGAALLGGGVGDTLADYYGNSRIPADILTMPDVQYSYGFNLGYGVGFSAPFLLPSYVPSCSFSCSSLDFISLARQYGLLDYGLTGQEIGESKICNFGVDAKQVLSCLLQNKGDSKEAANVDFLIDDLVEAGKQRIRLQKRLV